MHDTGKVHDTTRVHEPDSVHGNRAAQATGGSPEESGVHDTGKVHDISRVHDTGRVHDTRPVHDTGNAYDTTRAHDVDEVHDPTPVVLELPRDPRSPKRARRFVAQQCLTWGLDELTPDAELVVTELVTNAVIHAGSNCQVRLIHSGERLKIEVIDDGAGSPDMRLADSDEERGRGLLLVSMLTDAWGVESTPQGRGKRVWGDLIAIDRQPASASC